MRGEISFDLVMENEMEFVEGTFRLPGEPWRVFVVSRGDVTGPEVRPQVWNSGANGFFIRFPQSETLNRSTVESILSGATGVTEWEVVSGPDSMNLR